MYKIVKNRTFTTTATLMVPTDDGQVAQTMSVRFKVVQGAETMPVEEFLRASILHLGDIIDDNGEPVPYSPELLDQVILEPWARLGLTRAYWSEMSGGARAKN